MTLRAFSRGTPLTGSPLADGIAGERELEDAEFEIVGENSSLSVPPPESGEAKP